MNSFSGCSRAGSFTRGEGDNSSSSSEAGWKHPQDTSNMHQLNPFKSHHGNLDGIRHTSDSIYDFGFLRNLAICLCRMVEKQLELRIVAWLHFDVQSCAIHLRYLKILE